jgi:hypothetical protein
LGPQIVESAPIRAPGMACANAPDPYPEADAIGFHERAPVDEDRRRFNGRQIGR